MSKLVLSAFFLIILILFASFTTSFEYITMADNDNETSVKNATRNAMTESVNWGNARVNEEITINEEIAVEAVLRQYAETSNFYEAPRYLNIYQVSSDAPLLAVDSYTVVETPFNSMANVFANESNTNETPTRSREIVIYESKDLIKN